MKAQASIEFIALLSIALLASSILLDLVNDKALQIEKQSRNEEAQNIAQKTAYRLDLITSTENSSTLISYSDALDKNYTVRVGDGYVTVNSSTGPVSSRTVYGGKKHKFGTRSDKKISYQRGDIKIE